MDENRPPPFDDKIAGRLRDALTYCMKDLTWCGPIRREDLRSLRWAFSHLKQDNERLRAVLSTPEVYVGIISEAFEKHVAALIIERDEKIRRLELEVAHLKHLPTPSPDRGG